MSEQWMTTKEAARRLYLSTPQSLIGLRHRGGLQRVRTRVDSHTRGYPLLLHREDFERWRQEQGLTELQDGYMLYSDLRAWLAGKRVPEYRLRVPVEALEGFRRALGTQTLTPVLFRKLLRRSGARKLKISPKRYAYALADLLRGFHAG